jgi:SEC-C motif domain protein
MPDDPCPCGGGAYAACCGPCHAGGEAPTAEALMRSRYSAFARGDAAYLIRTSHPHLRARTSVRDLRPSFAAGWCGLEILAVAGGGPGDRTGEVRFRARHRTGVLEECSRFVRSADGAWLYRDGLGTVSG